MSALAEGIAHVSFPGGSVFLPARTSYDRETLIDYVAHNVHARGRVQVLVADQRWLADCGRHGTAPADCTACGRALAVVCHAAAGADPSPYCPHCVLAARTSTVPGAREQRQASAGDAHGWAAVSFPPART